MPTLTMNDIADLAKVRRPVVSMWRDRFVSSSAPFPEPVSIDPLRFDASAVAAWLSDTGHGNNPTAMLDLPAHSSVMGTLTASPRASSALLLLHELSGGAISDLTPSGVAALLEGHDSQAVLDAGSAVAALDDRDLCAAVDEVAEAAYSGAAALKALVDRLDTQAAPWRDGCLTEAGASLVGSVLDQLVGPSDSRLVPVGSGAVPVVRALLGARTDAVRYRFGRVAGQASDPSTDAAWRAIVADGHQVTHVNDAGGLALPDPSVVLLHDPRTRDADDLFATVDDLMLSLGPADSMVVIASSGALVDPVGATRRARTLRSEAGHLAPLRYVGRLPKGMVRYGGRRRLALWALAAHLDAQQPWTVIGDHSDAIVDPGFRDAVAADVAASLGSAGDVNAHAFRAASVVATERVASARSMVVAPRSTPTSSGGELLARIWQLDKALADELHLAAADGAPEQTVTLREASRRGLGRDIPGVRLSAGDIGRPKSGAVGVIGAPEIRGHEEVGARAIDRLVLVATAPRARFTEPGDVIYVAPGGAAALVDEAGGHVVQAPARILRCAEGASDGRRLVPAAVAADIARQPGRSRDSWRLRAVGADRAPALSAAAKRITERRKSALAELRRLAELEEALMTGLSAGSLTATIEAADAAEEV